MNFAEQILQKRNELGISLKALSEISGIPVMTIYNYEKGTQPTIGKADRLLKALSLTLELGKASDND